MHRHCDSLRKAALIEYRSDVNSSLASSPAFLPEDSGVENAMNSGNRITIDTFERRCSIVERRCDEVVRVLNRKAYKGDVTRALALLDQSMRSHYHESGSRRTYKLLRTDL